MSAWFALIVEDHAGTRVVLTGLLRWIGWEVVAAGTVADAMAALDRSTPFDFAMVDLVLPDGPGESLLSAIREVSPSTFVVVTTAISDPARIRDVKGMGAATIFQKPIDPIDVLAICRGISGC